MSKIINFKIIVNENITKQIYYEIDCVTQIEKYIEISGNQINKKEKKLEDNIFLNKMCVIEENIEKLKEVYISNGIIDGMEIKMNAKYDTGKNKTVVCINKVPIEVYNILKYILENYK